MHLKCFKLPARRIALSAAVAIAVILGIAFLPLRAIAGLESPCTYISDLISTNPLSSDLASTSDDHHRCIKLALKTTFPNVNGAVSATDEQLSQLDTGIFTSAPRFTGTPVELENAAWRLLLDETDAASNERLYDFVGSSGQLLGRTRTDVDGAGASWLTVDRTGATVDSIALAATAITLNGVAASDYPRLSQANTFAAANTYTQSGTTILLSSVNPRQDWNETDAAADNRRWYMSVSGEVFSFGVVNDALGSAADAITLNRTGTVVDSINLAATSVQINGNGVVRSLSGTYTPTVSNTTNVDSSTPLAAQYFRVGDVVTVAGEVDVDPTAALTTSFELSLPIASNFSATNNAGGGGGANYTTVPGLLVRAVAANDTVQVIYAAGGTGSADVHYTYTYLVQ